MVRFHEGWGSIGEKKWNFLDNSFRNGIEFHIKSERCHLAPWVSNFGKQSVGCRSKSNHSIYIHLIHSIFTNIPFPNDQQLKQPLPFARHAWHLQWLPKSVSCSCQNRSRHSPWPQQHTKHRQRHLSAPILHTKGGVLHPNLIPWVYLPFFLKCFLLNQQAVVGVWAPSPWRPKRGRRGDGQSL